MDEAGMTTPVIVFAVFDTDDRIVDAVQASARGYLVKSAARALIGSQVTTVPSAIAGSTDRPVCVPIL